jgi:hypothetical protein
MKDVESYRSQVNYPYWEVRAKAEQRDEMVDARRLIFEADKLIDMADMRGALETYEQAWVRWNYVFRRFPSMMTEEVGDDVLKSINRYRKLVEKDLDESFVLYEFMKFRRAYNADSLDFNVERTLQTWNTRAEGMKDDDDFFESIQGEGMSLKSQDEKPAEVAPEPVPMQETTEEESPKPAESETQEETRPPTLENPDFQN